MHRLELCIALLALLMLPSAAHADEYPTISTDGLYIGARLVPGGALSVAYDLDVYVTGNRLLSLGPAVSFSFLSEEGANDGQRQDYLLAADFLRFKIAITGEDGEVRFYPYLGAGMFYAWLPEQTTGPREVVLADGTMTTAEIRHPSLETFGALLSVGFGIDYFFNSNLGITANIGVHIRLGDEERIPIVWSALQAGLRFGL